MEAVWGWGAFLSFQKSSYTVRVFTYNKTIITLRRTNVFSPSPFNRSLFVRWSFFFFSLLSRGSILLLNVLMTNEDWVHNLPHRPPDFVLVLMCKFYLFGGGGEGARSA